MRPSIKLLVPRCTFSIQATTKARKKKASETVFARDSFRSRFLPPLSSLKAFPQSACLVVLLVVSLVGLLANRAQATHYFFDVNGITNGSGVANNGSYSWDGNSWNITAAGNTTAPIAWPDGANFPEFAAGTDAGALNYTVTASSNHTFAGMALQTSGGGTVTVASSGGAVLNLFSTSGGQGFFVGGSSTQNLIVTATIGGDAVTPLVWQGQLSGTAGSLFLYGNNTFSGGVDLNTSAGLNFNNNNSFGTGPIRWGFTGGTATSFTVSAPAASSAITIANAMATKSADTLVMADFAKPVTWSGAWTLATGTSTLDVRSNASTTISGIISGTNGTSALTKISPGTLTLSGANTYQGGTTISGGTLELSNASAKLGTGNVTVTGIGTSLAIDSGATDAIGNSATLSLSNNALLNLGAGVNERVGFLSLDTAFQPNTTYGSSQSNAVVKLDMYFSGTGILTVGPAIVAGDYNNDGIVDAADYVIWRKNVGQPSQTLPNDTTGVLIGDAQYNLWRTNFGSTTAVPGSGSLASSSAVPEPSSIGLLMLGLAALAAIGTLRGMNGISQHSRRR
jgi:autotransporter-associated beta strand protein